MTLRSPRRARRQRLARIRDGEIVGAARTVFARDGFDGASVADIAAAAGIAKGTVYLYYPSKEAIYFETLVRDLRDLRDRIVENVARAASFKDTLRAFVEAKVAFFSANRDFFRIYSAECGGLAQPPARFRKAVRELREEQLRFLEKAIVAGIRSGEIRNVPPRFVALAISEVTRSVVLSRLVNGAETPWEGDESAFLLDWFWKGLSKR